MAPQQTYLLSISNDINLFDACLLRNSTLDKSRYLLTDFIRWAKQFHTQQFKRNDDAIYILLNQQVRPEQMPTHVSY